jgi:glutathione S-transferase
MPCSSLFGRIKPTGKKPDGTPYYTLPAIHDTSTGTFLADSFLIAEYLEETYPNTPSIFPHGTRSLQHAFQFSFEQRLALVRPLIFPSVFPKLGTQRSEEYYRRTKELAIGRTLEEMATVGEERAAQWAKFRDGISKVDECLAKTDTKGPFVMGDTISWADFFISGYLMFFMG